MNLDWTQPGYQPKVFLIPYRYWQIYTVQPANCISQNHNIPFVKYWKPSYNLVVNEFRLDSTRLSTNNCNCSSVKFIWNLSFNARIVLTPLLKQGSWEPVKNKM